MLLAYFGTEMRSYVQRSDVAASAWFEERAPAGSFRAYMAPNFPLSMTANYATKRIFPDPEPALTALPEFQHRLFGPVDVVRIRQLLLEHEAPERYFVISPSQENYADLYKLLPPGSVQRLIEVMLASPDFQLAFRDGDAYVFRLVPSAPGARRPRLGRALRSGLLPGRDPVDVDGRLGAVLGHARP